jgi:hypothetical protein
MFLLRNRRKLIVASLWIAVMAAAGYWSWPSQAQLAPPPSSKEDPSRFDFMVVESFDAQYLGDTPGHIGRGGALGKKAPGVALGDPVYREDTSIGRVSRVQWDRTKESLDIEFDPDSSAGRISVGDAVWVRLH